MSKNEERRHKKKTEKGIEPKDDTIKKIYHILNGNPRSKGEKIGHTQSLKR